MAPPPPCPTLPTSTTTAMRTANKLLPPLTPPLPPPHHPLPLCSLSCPPQELARFNALLSVLRRTLSEVQRAVRGLAVMSADMEAMALALVNNQVPGAWARAAYPSLKPLASWVKDFHARMEAMAAWLYQGEPTSFWLPGLFFPQVRACICICMRAVVWRGGSGLWCATGWAATP